MTVLHRGFEDIDRDNKQAAFFEFLDLAADQPSVIDSRDRMIELCPVEDGFQVLEVGCGLGHEARRLAKQAGKDGRVVGIDISNAFVQEAQKRSQNLSLSLEFSVGDAQNLEFEDNTFDVCRAERVLLFIDDPVLAISEMARVTRPGGRVIIYDFDHNAFFIDSNLQSLTRKIETLMRASPKHPSLSHDLPYLMRNAGLNVNAIELSPMYPSLRVVKHLYGGLLTKAVSEGQLTKNDVDEWWQDQEAMDAANQFSHVNVGYLVAATKP